MVKNLPDKARDLRNLGSIPGLGRSPGGVHGNLFQHSCLENSMDHGVWQVTVYMVTEMKQLSTHHAHAFITPSLVMGWEWGHN